MYFIVQSWKDTEISPDSEQLSARERHLCHILMNLVKKALKLP